VARPRALVIDDDASVHSLVEEALCPRILGSITRACRPGDGIRAALNDPPDVVLLDVNMPGIDGFKVCQLLKENVATRHVPILFLTVDRNVVHLARALDCGAADWIRKPVNPLELQARVRVALRDKQLVDLLREQARMDALTRLHNRAAFDDALSAVASAWDRHRTPATLLLLDLDDFKRVNDEHGHGVGDELLRQVGEVIRGCCRPYDTPCRIGGDEFAVVFQQVEGKSAHGVCERLVQSLRALEIPTRGAGLRITSSAGLVSTEGLERCFAPNELLECADAALYAAKDAGRDHLVVGAFS
jgi:diguanylate cyclase (GGDEF)-like protein